MGMFGKVNNPKGINQWSNVGAILKAQVKKVGNTLGAKLNTAKDITKGAPKVAKVASELGKGLYKGAKLSTKVSSAVNNTSAKLKNKIVDIGIAPNKAELKRGMNSAAENAKSKISHAKGTVTKALKGIDTKKVVNSIADKGDSVIAAGRKGVNRGIAGAKNIGLEINHKVTKGPASAVKTIFKKAKNNAVGSTKNAVIDAGVIARKAKRRI